MSKPEVVYLVVSEPDGWNRRKFWALWPDWIGPTRETWGVRGQIFNAVLSEHVGKECLDRSLRRELVIYLKDLQAKQPGLSEDDAMRYCEDLVRTERSAT